MNKLHCDLCDRDMSKDENFTQVIWKDNNGIAFEFECFHRAKRRFKADICDCCLEKLKDTKRNPQKNDAEKAVLEQIVDAINRNIKKAASESVAHLPINETSEYFRGKFEGGCESIKIIKAIGGIK